MDENASREWLTWLYGEKFDGNIWIGGHANWRGGRFADIDAAVSYAAALDAAGQGRPWGVYHRLTTLNDTAEKRGEDEDSVMLPALMMDVDLDGPGHKPAKLPRPAYREQVEKILEDAGAPEPTTWIESGGGLYPVWRLASPLLLGDATSIADAQEVSRALHRRVIDAAALLGWKVDNTSDLSRVYRLPGTTNRKIEGREVTARWLKEGVNFGGYALADFPRPQARAQPVDMSESLEGFTPDEQAWMGGIAAFFATPAEKAAARAGETRSFTVEQAMEYVRPALDALATAADGEINVRLNEAACMLAHFGPEFWDEAAADRQLNAALACTMYDGRTWKAADTVASARRAMGGDWRAVLVPVTAEQAQAAAAAAGEMDPVDLLLAEMLQPGEIISRPAPRYLIHGLLQFDSESWLIGPPGSKKSFVVLDMAARVTRGETWQGRRTNAADVVMIVAEGAGGAGKRLAAWEKRNGPIGEGRMFILPRPVQAGSPAAWAVLVEACRRLASSAGERGRGLLVILDTQARVTVGLKENDATDMGVFVGAVSAIRQATDACVVVVHHTGRAGGDARGSSAIDGAQTTELKVLPGKGKLAAKLIVEKQKDIEEIEPMRLGFEIVDVGVDDDGMPLTSLVLAEQDSLAFKLAWEEAEAGQGDGGHEAPIMDRVTLDPWIAQRGDPRSNIQRWIVQALVDTAETLGLTKTDVKAIVNEKVGKKIEMSTFNRAWQKVTEEGGAWDDVIVKAGGERWTVDRVAISGLKSD